MTDTYTDPQSEGGNPLRDHLKKVEAERDRLAAEVAEAAQAKQELAMIRAGIDPDSKKGKLLLKVHDGDFTPEALRQTALDYELIDPPAPTSAPPQEQAAWGQMASNATAGSAANSEPRDEAYWAKKLQEAGSQKEYDAVKAEARAAGLLG